MNPLSNIEELQKKYEALELRVTRFSAIEQELINTRDRLDHELVVYKRLQEFNLRALKLQELEKLIALITETVIDVFEVESALVHFTSQDPTHEYLMVEGISQEELPPSKDISKLLEEFKLIYSTGKTCQIKHNELKKQEFGFFESLLLYSNDAAKEGLNFQISILGGITLKNAPLYEEISSHQMALFTVLCHKSISLIRNFINTDRIAKQMELIKESEKNLKASKEVLISKNSELQKINQELDRFVYSVSHDLRSPLLSIKGIIDLIFKVSAVDQETTEYLKMAETSVQRLDDTIQEILSYSRNARLKVELKSFDVVPMVYEIFDQIKYAAPDAVDFIVETQGESVIYTDEIRLKTLLKNLISNSFKYRSDKNRKPFIKFSITELEGTFKLIIEDNGEGILKSSLDKVFDMFFRASKNSVGTGLGLYICKEIVDKLNGTISINSEVNKGTMVRIELPKIQENE